MPRRVLSFSLTLLMTAWLVVLFPAHQCFPKLCGEIDGDARQAGGHSTDLHHTHDDAKCVICLHAAGFSHVPFIAVAVPPADRVEVADVLPVDLPVLAAPSPVYHSRGPPVL